MSVFAFLDVPASYALHAVAALAGALHPLLGATATAAVIVLTTVLVRLALHPLARVQVRGEKLRARLAPQLKELTARHKDDPARLREAQAELYRSEGGSPLAGCLPSLVMWPFIAVLYRLFSLPVLGGHANTLLAGTIAGIPLGTRLTGALPGQLPVFLVLYALLAAAALVAFRRARRAAASADPAAPAAPGAGLVPYLSFGTMVFAAFVPLSAGLYLLTTTVWTLAERGLLRS